MGQFDPLGVAREFIIGAADIDARAQGLALCGSSNMGPIKALRVVAGSGVLVYVDEVTLKVQKLGDQVALQVGDEIDGLLIRSINGTANASPSAALTLRVRW